MSTAFPAPGPEGGPNPQSGGYNQPQAGGHNQPQAGAYYPPQAGGYYPPQQPPQPAPKKRGGCLKWGLIILGVLLLLGLIGGLMGESGDDATPQSATETGIAAEQETGAPEPVKEKAGDAQAKNEALAIGETADLKGLKVTVAGLRDEGVDVLDTNHVCVDVAVKNDSAKAVDVSQFAFSLTTPAGITVDSTFTGSTDFQTATVNPGGQMSGVICFESDGAPGEYVVGYEPFWATRTAFWNGAL